MTDTGKGIIEDMRGPETVTQAIDRIMGPDPNGESERYFIENQLRVLAREQDAKLAALEAQNAALVAERDALAKVYEEAVKMHHELNHQPAISGSWMECETKTCSLSAEMLLGIHYRHAAALDAK